MPDKGEVVNDAKNLVQGGTKLAEGAGRLAGGDVDPSAIMDTVQGAAQVAKPAAKIWLTCCAAEAAIGIFVFLLIVGIIGGPSSGQDQASADTGDAKVRVDSCTTGEYPNITDEKAYADAINKYIKKHASGSSPLQGMGSYFVAGGKAAGVNPAYVVTIAEKESSFGTAIPGSSHNSFGRTSTSSQPHVVVNGRNWYKWDSWAASLSTSSDTEFDYIKRMYIDKKLTSIHDIVYKYAPPSENATDKYIKQVISWMNEINTMAGSAVTCK